METFWEVVLQVISFVFIVIAISLLISFPIKWLWNWLMPEIFGLTTITVWQALGLSLLSGLLFNSSNTSKS